MTPSVLYLSINYSKVLLGLLSLSVSDGTLGDERFPLFAVTSHIDLVASSQLTSVGCRYHRVTCPAMSS